MSRTYLTCNTILFQVTILMRTQDETLPLETSKGALCLLPNLSPHSSTPPGSHFMEPKFMQISGDLEVVVPQ